MNSDDGKGRGGDRPFRSTKPQGGFRRDDAPRGGAPFQRSDGPRGGAPFRRNDTPRSGGFRRDDAPRGGAPFRRDEAPRSGGFRRDDAPRGGSSFERDQAPHMESPRDDDRQQPENQGWRPFSRESAPREGTPRQGFQGGDRPRGDTPFRERERPFAGHGDQSNRPPFREQRPEGDRPQGNFERGGSNSAGPRGGNDRFERGGERPFRDAPREGASGRPFGRDDRDQWRGAAGPERRPYGDRPFTPRDGGQDRPFTPRGGQDRPFTPRDGGQDRPFTPRPPNQDRPFARRPDREGEPPAGRRFDSERPAYGSRPPYGGPRPPFGGDGGRRFDRPDSRREERPSFEDQGTPLGTATRLGRPPVNQFEHIQADVYGRWPVLESLRAGNVLKIFLAAGVKDAPDHLQEIQTLAAEKHIPIIRVDRFALDRQVGGANHQGIVATCKPHQYAGLEDIMQAAKQSEELPLLVLFDGVQDPQNLGSILRTAEAVGAQGAVLPKHQQVGVTPAVVRASAGAAEHLAVAEVTNLRQSIDKLKEAGYWIVGLDMEGGTDYDNFDVDSPIALIIGAEGRGLGRLITEQCDYLVRLPMRGKVSSLNASVAAGIVLYEIDRKRTESAKRKGTPRRAARGAVAADAHTAVIPGTDVVAQEVSAQLTPSVELHEEQPSEDEVLLVDLIEEDGLDELDEGAENDEPEDDADEDELNALEDVFDGNEVLIGDEEDEDEPAGMAENVGHEEGTGKAEEQAHKA